MAEVRLYDSGRQWVDVAVDDEPTRDSILEYDNSVYIWDQRNGRWSEAASVVRLSSPRGVAKPEDKPEDKPVPPKVPAQT